MNHPHVRNNLKDTTVSILADDRSGNSGHYIDFFLPVIIVILLRGM